MNTENFEIFRKIEYKEFVNKDKVFQLSTYPYLDIVMHDHCNSRCRYCIAHLLHEKLVCEPEKMFPGIDYAINKLGVQEVLLLGGEPTLFDQLFEMTEYLKKYKDEGKISKICLTTNGYKLLDHEYRAKLFASGITHLNISYMSIFPEKQIFISQNGTGFITIKDLKDICTSARLAGISVRLNANVFKDNLDTVPELLEYYDTFKGYVDSIKFSPLLKTDSFSTVNEVTKFNKDNTLSDMAYDKLWAALENYFNDCPIVRNKETFGFVEYSMIMLDKTPIVLNYNQHGKLREKVITENKINNLKLLPTGDLSLSWNREESDFFIEVK